MIENKRNSKSIHFISGELQTHVKEYEEVTKEWQREVEDYVLARLSHNVSSFEYLCESIAELDVLLGFSRVAVNEKNMYQRFSRPNMVSRSPGSPSTKFTLVSLSHPCVEEIQQKFSPNDLDFSANIMHLIFGPNMSKKQCRMHLTG
jgi:DNA mismatch repair ATPase MutS